MTAVDPKLQRWVYASIAKHLHAAATTASLPLVVEVLDTPPDTWKEAKHRAEVIISGPSTREISKGLRRVQVSIFCVVSSFKQVTNAYDHLDKVGALANALDRCIEVRDYDVGNDAPALIGELKPRAEDTDRIRVDHIKPTESDNRTHSVIEANLVGFFTEE